MALFVVVYQLFRNLSKMPVKDAIQCKICKKNVTKSQTSIQCAACSSWLHVSCAGVSEDVLAVLNGKQGLYIKCKDCLVAPTTDVSSLGGDIRSIHEKMDRVLKKMDEDRKELHIKLDSAIKDIRTELLSTVTDLRKDISVCHNAIRRVESSTEAKMSKLETENNSLHRRINRCDIIINGLPDGLENLLECVIAIGSFYKIILSNSDINHVFYANQNRSIIVKFNSVHIRDSIMKEYFKTRNLLLKNVIGGEITSRLYLNDHLSPASSRLNMLCRRLIKQQKILKFMMVHSDKPRVRLTLLNGEEVTSSYEECLKLI